MTRDADQVINPDDGVLMLAEILIQIKVVTFREEMKKRSG